MSYAPIGLLTADIPLPQCSQVPAGIARSRPWLSGSRLERSLTLVGSATTCTSMGDGCRSTKAARAARPPALMDSRSRTESRQEEFTARLRFTAIAASFRGQMDLRCLASGDRSGWLQGAELRVRSAVVGRSRGGPHVASSRSSTGRPLSLDPLLSSA